MKAKSLEQINRQGLRLLAQMSSRRDANSRYTLVETIMRKYRANIYSHLDNKFGDLWAAKPNWREKLTIPVPASIYIGRGQ